MNDCKHFLTYISKCINNIMVIDVLLSEFKKRNINWMTDAEFIVIVNELYEKHKDTYPVFEDVLNLLSPELIVDAAINLFLDKNKNNEKGIGILKAFREIQKNPILKKIKPWFKVDLLLSNFIYKSFSNEIASKYNNIWKNAIKSEVNLTYKENYIINEDGFRTSYHDEKYIACFGCEKTFGENEKEDEIWPSLLSKKLQIPCENYGDIDISCDTITRYIWQYIQYKKPEAIFILFPDIKRMEYFNDDNQIINLSPDVEFESPEFMDSYNKISNGSNSLLKFLQNYLMIKITCKNKNIPFYWYTKSKDVLGMPFKFFTFNEKDIDHDNTYSDGKSVIDIDPKDILSPSEYNSKLVEIFLNLYNGK